MIVYGLDWEIIMRGGTTQGKVSVILVFANVPCLGSSVPSLGRFKN